MIGVHINSYTQSASELNDQQHSTTQLVTVQMRQWLTICLLKLSFKLG